MPKSGTPADRGASQHANDHAPLKYSELIDVQKLQALMESLARVTGLATAMIAVDGTVIAKAGGQQACNEFHRQSPDSCARCLESDTALAESMTQGRPYAVYSCLNGLTDTAAPIIVNGEHVANMFAGQFLTGPPDLEFFRRQARQAGFDAEKYLAAIAQVPIILPERVQAITALFVQLASVFADVGMDRIRQLEISDDLRHLNADLENRVAARTRELARQKEYLEAIFAAEPECLTVVSAQGILEDINPAGLKMLEATTLDEAREKVLVEYVDPDFREAFLNLQQRVFSGKTGVLEFSLTGTKGTRRWLEMHAAPLHDENQAVVSLLGITRDVTDRKTAEDAFRQMAFYDRLTNLPNRRLLEDRLRQLLARSRRSSLRLSLLFIDLDKFKPINDELGHATGDWLLQRVAERMRKCLRESDTVARIGGDEFVVLLPDTKSARNAVRVAEKIRATLELPFITTDGVKLTISSSIGAVLYPDHADNPRDLLRLGDETMYRAKKLGRNAVELYGPTNDDEDFEDPEDLPEEGQSIIQLSWKQAYACGEPTIDQEHQELLQIANTLLDRLAASTPNPMEVMVIFDTFIEDLTLHCAHEEDILRTHRYRDVEAHTAEHRKLISHAGELRKQCATSETAFDKLVDFLTSEVVLGHLVGEDRKYYGLFAEMRRSRGN